MVQHIDHALVGKAHPPMYLLHKWWARKPHNVVRAYIEAYSNPGDVVLDPFLGSGPTVVEAVRSGRRALGFDLDPLAIFISRFTSLHVNLKTFTSHYEAVRKAVQKEIEKLYLTSCPKCKTDVPITHVIRADKVKCGKCGVVSPRGDPVAKKPVNKCPACHASMDLATKIGTEMLEIGYFCPTCMGSAVGTKRFLSKKPTPDDVTRLETIEKKALPAWVPDDRFYYPDGKPFQKKEHSEKVTDLFDKRALIALSLLYQAIDTLPKGRERDLMRLCFSSNLHSVSRLNMVHGLRWSKGTLPSRAWVIHSFYVPPLRIEFPVWFYFNERYEKFLDGKSDSNAELSTHESRSVKALLNGNGNMFLKSLNAIDLDHSLPRDSVDYVFTDPPYGGAIQYLELSSLYTSWLRGPRGDDFELDFKDEITINHSQQKGFDYYHRMLRAAFDNVFHVLKPDGYMTVTFHATDIKVWNSILEAINLSGFEMQKIVYQPPPVKSIKSMMQPYGSAQGDYYIRFHKPKKGKITGVTKDEALYEKIIVQAARKIIATRGEPTPFTIILNGIVPELQRSNGLLKGSKPVQDVLKSRVNKDFVLVNALDAQQKIVGKKWWLKDPGSVPFLDKVPLDERVETAVLEVLRSKIRATFDEILQEIFVKFPNSLTPDTVSIQSVLKEYGEKASDSQWRLRNDVRAREGEHSLMIRAVAELGKKLGFKVWIGRREQSDVADGVRLGDLCDEKSLSLPNINAAALKRVAQIDVIWYDGNGKIDSIFEVENTTGITDALIRASNIPYKCNRFVILPEERQALMRRKLSEPAFKDRFDLDAWGTIYYSVLLDHWRQVSNRKTIKRNEFAGIVNKQLLTEKEGQFKLFDA